MDNCNGINKNPSKYLKKKTKFVRFDQKLPKLRNVYHFGSEDLVHHSFKITKKPKGKFPEIYQIHPEPHSCCIVIKRSIALKRYKINKNNELQLQEQPCRDKKIYESKLFMTRNEDNLLNKNFKKKYPTPKHPKFFLSCLATQAVHNKNLDAEKFQSKVSTSSQPNIWIINNSGNPLLFGCSADSLQLPNSKDMVSMKNTETTLDGNIPSWKKKENWKTVENCNNESRIISREAHSENNITVYRVIDSYNRKQSIVENCEDNAWSSMSTCSSSSSTREYYLPAVSGSTDTVQVAEVLTKQRQINWSKSGEDSIKKSNKTAQIKHKVLNNRKKKKYKKVCTEAPNHDERMLINNDETSHTNSLKKKYNQLFSVLEGNDGLFPFFLLNNMCNLVIKKKLNNDKIHGKEIKKNTEDVYDNGCVHITVNSSQNHNTTYNIPETTRNEFTPLKKSQSTTVMKVANDELTNKKQMPFINCDDKKQITRKSIFNINCKPSNQSNDSFSYENRKTKSEDNLLKMKIRKPDEEIDNKNSAKKIKNLSSIVDSKSNILNQLRIASPTISNESAKMDKTKFIKLDPFFDIDFKDPKISRLVVPSTILAGESEGVLHKKENEEIRAESDEKKNEERIQKFISNLIKNNSYIKVKSSSETTNISMDNLKNGIDISNSNNAIVFTDSIIDSSGAFKKIKDKFNNLNSKTEASAINKTLCQNGSMGKDGGIIGKEMKREHSNNFSNNKYFYQTIKSEGKDNFRNECTIKTNLKKSPFSSKINILSVILKEKKKFSPILSNSISNITSGIASTHQNDVISQADMGKLNVEFSSFIEKLNYKNSYLANHSWKSLESVEEHKKDVLTNNDIISNTSEQEVKSIQKSNRTLANKAIQVELLMNVSPKQEDKETEMPEKEKNINIQTAIEVTEKLETTTNISTSKFTKGKVMIYNGQPIILYNSSGYPVTDVYGRLLKNNLGAYLLSTDKYDEILKKNVPVFDCELRSASNNSFDPTKRPSMQKLLKITDRCGNPVSLYNNLGLPLTDEDGQFLYDNCGMLLVKMDNFNFPICCSNGSPVYLQNGAMLLSQKYKFIITLLNTDSSNQSVNKLCNINYSINKRICFNNGNNIATFDKQIKDTTSSIKSENNQSKRVPKSDYFCLNFQMNKKKHSLFESELLLDTCVPGLINKQKQSVSTGGIPQSPIPIFDMEGNKLTDENGYPLKNKYGEYMLLLDKNGFAISDSCGGPIFNAEGKQLLLKDMYQMYKPPLDNFSRGGFIPIEYPNKHHKNIKPQNIGDISEEELPLLDLKFENHHHSEPIMNYLNANKIGSYNNVDISEMDIEEVGWIKHEIGQLMENCPPPEHFADYPILNKKQLIPSPITSNKEAGLFYQTDNYEEQLETEMFDGPFFEENDYFIPYLTQQYLNHDLSNDQHPEQDDQLYRTENMYLCKDDYFYYDSGMSGTELFKDLNVQYCSEDEEGFVHY